MKKSINRVAHRWLKADGDLLQQAAKSLSVVRTYLDHLTKQESVMTALVAAGESGRLDRSERVVVKSARVTQTTVEGEVQGTGGIYNVRITILPNRAWTCTCPDKARRGLRTGPCKHALAFANYWLIKRVHPSVADMNDRLMGILEHSDL